MIYGLRRLVKYFEVKIFNLLKFDYYSGDLFLIQAFKESAIECSYRDIDPIEFGNTYQIQNWKKNKYIFNKSTLQYEKNFALWEFNAVMNTMEYVEMMISDYGNNPSLPKKGLGKDLINIYDNWRDGSMVTLWFAEKKGQIDIKMIGDRCELGKGVNFDVETDLKAGDEGFYGGEETCITINSRKTI